jgi:hypothetical protein
MEGTNVVRRNFVSRIQRHDVVGRSSPQRLKPPPDRDSCGTAEAVPFQKQRKRPAVLAALCSYCAKLKIAPTVALFVMVSEHVGWLSGMQLADHPPKVDPAAGTAVKVTEELSTKFPVQPPPEPQSIPAGMLVTVPEPWPTS